MNNMIKFNNDIFIKSTNDDYEIVNNYEYLISIFNIVSNTPVSSMETSSASYTKNITRPKRLSKSSKARIIITATSSAGPIKYITINGIACANYDSNNDAEFIINDVEFIDDIYQITVSNITFYKNNTSTGTKYGDVSGKIYAYNDDIDTEIPTIKIGGSKKYIPGTTSIGSGDPQGYNIEIGANNITFVKCNDTGSWFITSDRRDKTDFQPIENAYEFINSLTPLTYVMNQRYRYTDENGNFNEEEYLNKTRSSQRRQAGLVAQDVRENVIEIYKDDNYAQIVDIANYDYPNSDDDTHSMSYTSLVPFLIGAINKNYERLKKLEGDLNE